MKLIFLSYRNPDNYFRINLLKEGAKLGHDCLYIQIKSYFKFEIFNWDKNGIVKNRKANIFMLPQISRGSSLAVCAFAINQWYVGIFLRFFISSKKWSFDYYDDLFFANETLRERISHSIWNKFCHFVLVLNPLFKSRFSNSVNFLNASHIERGKIESNKFVIGVIANIGKRFRFDILKGLCEKLPNIEVHLYGRIAPHLEQEKDEIKKTLFSLQENPRFQYYGEYHPNSLQKLLSTFSIGLIPYFVDEKTIFINPDKYYHYSNFGLEIFAPHIPALLDKKNVTFFYSFEDLVEKIGNYKMSESPQNFNYSWEMRFHELVQYLNK